MTQPPADFSLTATIREVERHWLARLPAGSLMERAAAAVASQADRIARFRPRGGTIIALVGPGNNGGDALLALTALRDRGYPVEALALAPEHMPAAADAARARARWSASGATLEALSMLESSLSGAALVIDGLFGIGLSRGLDGNAAKAATLLAGASGTPVLAVDVPSGIDADTGAIVGGRGHVAVRADLTVTMIADKPGLATGDGLAHAGRSVLASLGLPAAPVDGRRIDRAHVAGWMPARARNAHKGSHGTVSVVGGAEGMRGAALLAARAAQCAGAGKVIVTGPDGPSFDSGQPQLMSAEPAPAPAAASAIAIGCGLGRQPQALELLCQCLARPVPLVADADALNLIAGDTGTAALTALRARSAQTPTVLTPTRSRRPACSTPTPPRYKPTGSARPVHYRAACPAWSYSRAREP
ncbi:MAG: NAD(P)H-hydrate epimerase [Burkholderiaceae bacterium]